MAVPHVVALRAASAAIARLGEAPAAREESARRWRPPRPRSRRAARSPRARSLWAAARAACRLGARRRASRRPRRPRAPCLDRKLAGDRDVLRQRRLGDRRVEREEDRQAGRGAVDVAAADHVDVQVEVAGSMPASARSTLVALNTESLAIEPAVSLKRTVPLPACDAGNATASISMMLPRYCVHAQPEALADLAPGAPVHGRVAHQAAGLHDRDHVVFGDRRTPSRARLACAASCGRAPGRRRRRRSAPPCGLRSYRRR